MTDRQSKQTILGCISRLLITIINIKSILLQIQNDMMLEQGPQQSQQDINISPLIYKIKQYRANNLLSEFSYMLIRPPRFLYNQQLLTPPEYYQYKFKVEQHQIPFKMTLYKCKKMRYVILYLHGNSSSRFEGYMHLRELPDEVGLACFDFSGCGMRFESQFITLGNKQSKEVDIAAKYLKSLGYKVVGWGRSMGSVSLLLSQELDVLVADSPFASLQQLCRQSSYNFIPSICCCFFHCLYPCLFSCVRSDVRQKAGFDLRELQISNKIAANPRNKYRSLFIMAGTEDGMINYSHSQKIYDAFPGKKMLQIFQGTHNSHRPCQVYDKCFLFIEQQLGIKRQNIGDQLHLNSNTKKHNIRLKPINKNELSVIAEKQQLDQSTLSQQKHIGIQDNKNPKQSIQSKHQHLEQSVEETTSKPIKKQERAQSNRTLESDKDRKIKHQTEKIQVQQIKKVEAKKDQTASIKCGKQEQQSASQIIQ